MIWIYVTETLLYLCFSLLIGTLVIQLVPSHLKPHLKINKRVLQVAILGIAFLSAAPVIRLILFLYEDIGLLVTTQNVIGEFEVGQAWTVTVFISVFFYLFVSLVPVFKRKAFIGIALVFSFILLLAVGWASHAASLTDWSGFVVHTLHFTAVTVWVGLLLVVSWFSTTAQNWLSFLKWYTPVALSCLAIVIGSGIFIMTLAVDVTEYQDAWMMPYGQAILLKHLLVLPVLLFAWINGVWMRRKLQRGEDINPVPWSRAESVVLLLIFAATAVLGQQEPPHSIEAYLKGSGASDLFRYFYSGQIDPAMHLQVDFTLLGSLFFGVAVIFGFLVLYCFKQKAPSFVSLLMSLFSVLALYVGLMMSIS